MVNQGHRPRSAHARRPSCRQWVCTYTLVRLILPSQLHVLVAVTCACRTQDIYNHNPFHYHSTITFEYDFDEYLDRNDALTLAIFRATYPGGVGKGPNCGVRLLSFIFLKSSTVMGLREMGKEKKGGEWIVHSHENKLFRPGGPLSP